jgi:hypothetical protein
MYAEPPGAQAKKGCDPLGITTKESEVEISLHQQNQNTSKQIFFELKSMI